MSYTSKTRVQNYLQIDIDSTFDTQIDNWIEAVGNYIDKYTGRKDGFGPVVVDTIKYYDGNNQRELRIDDCVEITKVEVLEADGEDVEWTLTEGKESDFITYPYNGTPFWKLILGPSATIGAWYSGKKRIKITGKWGVNKTEVPHDIELAATMMVADIVEKGYKGGKIASESLGDYSVSFANLDQTSQSLNIKKILDSYKIFRL